VVCLVGKPCSNWIDLTTEKESQEGLGKQHIRAVRYQELVADAYGKYQAFLEKSDEAGRIYNLIRNIEDYEWGDR